MDPHLQAGQVAIADEFWLGQAHAGLALANKVAEMQRKEQCGEALQWLHKALPFYIALRADRSNYDGPDRVPEIQRTIQQCTRQ
jgi:hypothetical protein